jgi:5-formyltetrahydrofolate cyclo-ligase
MNDKIFLRKMFIKQREKMNIPEMTLKNKVIVKNILEWDIYKKSSKILSYMSIRNEVNLLELNNEIINMKKKLYLPCCTSSDGKNDLDIYRVLNIEKELKVCKYNILEPFIKKNRKKKNILDLVLVPGAVFDKNGGRIGFGAGYYDTFLEDIKSKTIKAGICFDFQLKDRIDIEKHDVLMDYVITEKGVLEMER